jgi:two-component system cell cycle sensor histidine kinase/response regulator CckA
MWLARVDSSVLMTMDGSASPLDVEQYRALLEHSKAMVRRADAHGNCNYLDAAWLAFTGRALAQELGDGWAEGVHPEDASACRATYLEHVSKHQPFEMVYRLRRFDGVYRKVVDRTVPYRDATGVVVGMVGSCTDVDDRRGDEVFTRTDEFFDMSIDNVCVAGLDGYFKRLNPSWSRTLGWTTEELLSKPSVEFVHPEDRDVTLAGRERLREGTHMGPLTNRYLCKDGSYRWLEWRSVADPVRGLVYAAARDVTEQKTAEDLLLEGHQRQATLQRQLVFADRMASVGTLAAGVAHEINNPLAYVMTNINLIAEGLASNRTLSLEDVAELREMAAEAQLGAERIRKIVRGLKTFSRSEEERRVVLEVQPLLELSINMAYNEIRHRARLVKDYGKIPPVDADEARLGQVFINLLVNAVQALPEPDGASNEIRVLTSTDPAGRAVIEIRDNGRGIPAEIIGRVFDPFFTTKPVGIGTGLGLSICHTIVHGMGGEITVTSPHGGGTTFRVVLPAASRLRAEPPALCLGAQKAVARATVLVVDDEPAVGNVLRRLLRDHQVTVMTTAKQALELLFAGSQFDVILSDLMMPEMSGMDFYDELLLHFPEAARRVIFVSGGAFTPTANAFLDRVSNERIDKPFDSQRVRDIVQRSIV